MLDKLITTLVERRNDDANFTRSVMEALMCANLVFCKDHGKQTQHVRDEADYFVRAGSKRSVIRVCVASMVVDQGVLRSPGCGSA